MKNVKIGKFFNVFNMIFIFIMSFVLGISVYVGSFFNQIANAISSKEIIIEQFLNVVNKSEYFAQFKDVLANANLVYLLLSFTSIFLIFMFIFIISLILNAFYKRSIKSFNYTYSILSLLTSIFLIMIVFSNFSFGIFNFLIYKNPVFIFINVVLFISLIAQVIFISKHLVNVYNEIGFNINIKTIHKFINTLLVLVLIFIGLSFFKNLIVYLFINTFINNLDFASILNLKELFNYFIDSLVKTYPYLDNIFLSTGIDFVLLSGLNMANGLISSFILSLINPYFIKFIVIDLVLFFISIYLLITSNKYKGEKFFSIGQVIFCIVLIIFSLYLLVFAKIILGPVLAIGLLCLALTKLYVIYVSSDIDFKAKINNK